MGTNAIATANDGDTIKVNDPNQYNDSLSGDLVPRNTDGAPSSNAGDIGTTTFPFKNANVVTGYLHGGMVTAFHSYNGLVSMGQGWMKLNGDIVNETNYDAIHGAGSWDEYIGDGVSQLEGLHLPNMNNRYFIGVTDHTEDGTSSIASVGNANHSQNIASHNHTGFNHNHTFSWLIVSQGGGPVQGVETFTAVGLSGNGALSQDGDETVDVQPDSQAVEFWIRII